MSDTAWMPPPELAAILREPWRYDEADPRFDPHEADVQGDEDES